MTTKEIINTQNNIYKFLFERRLKESFGLLGQLISILQDWQITESLNEMETSYKYMIQYMLDGFNDPERKKIYDKLILSTYNLTDKVTDSLKENHLHYTTVTEDISILNLKIHFKKALLKLIMLLIVYH